MSDQSREDRDDHLGTTTEVLLEVGEQQSAALLLDVVRLDYIYIDIGWGAGEERVDIVAPRLAVPVPLVERFTPEVIAIIHSALQQVAIADEMLVRSPNDFRIVPAAAAPGWRDRIDRALAGGPSNQASLAPLGATPLREDRMNFRDAAELAVYRALKAVQAEAKPERTITILPNPSARVVGHTWEPDFVVTLGGRVGILEVDGASHSGRAAIDRSRDRIFEDGGIAYVDRIVVEDATHPEEVDRLVRRFLKRLAAS